MDNIRTHIARHLLSIGAVFLRPDEPFVWASGIKSPIYCDNRLTLTAIHPQLASSRGIPVGLSQTLFTAAIAVVVTLSISSVGLLILNSLLVLPGASARNVARNLKQYHGFSVLFAFLAGVVGLTVSYYSGCSAGAAISLGLAAIFAVTFCLRKVRA